MTNLLALLATTLLLFTQCLVKSTTAKEEENYYNYNYEDLPDDGLPEDKSWTEILHQYNRSLPHKREITFVDYYSQRPITEQQLVGPYDFIVVGSGSAGAALANRLSENPNWKILLLEVGKQADFYTDIPAMAALFQQTNFNWGYLMEKQDNMGLALEGQRMAWPRGRALGGSTIINYMIHVRGNPLDYDRWAAMGNPGWSYKEVLPYLKKLENSEVKVQDAGYHNEGGPVNVQDVPFRSKAVEAWVQACQEAGHPYVDYNGKDQMGVSYAQATTVRGRRCSTEYAYLRGIRSRPNLTILTKSRVTKLIMDGHKRITGVEYVYKRQFRYATTTKEVILSAGTFNSPQILMLSGIGPADHLKELGIPLVQNLPVGQKLYDHLTFLGLVFTVNRNNSISNDDLFNPRYMIDFVTKGEGPLTSLGGVEALTYIKTNVSQDLENYPDMELIFVGGGMHTDKGEIYRKTFRISDRAYNKVWKPLESIERQVWSVFPMLVHPKSHGYLKLKSRNPYHWPKFYGNFFSDPQNSDVRTFIAAIREVQRILQTPTYRNLDVKQVDIPIPGCENHLWDSDEYWECALRHITGTLHHQVATNKMGPAHDPEAVVDHQLKVYGVENLRVADCSVIPLPLTAHTNVPAIMIGEKAADLIKQEWSSP